MAKEYIEREAAEKELMYAMVGTGYQSRAIDAIKFMPTADVVEVVRCKDCVHYCLQTVDGGRYCELLKFNSFTDNGFCSFGAKMDGKCEDDAWKKAYQASL